MLARTGPAAEEEFAKRAWDRAMRRLVEVRQGGGTVSDEGDFIAREVDQAYMERAEARGDGDDVRRG